jgi:hypothetical protein
MASHPIDSSRLPLNDFCFRSNSAKPPEMKSGKVRDVVDALRTVYWFHSLRIGLKAKSTYQLEKLLEPNAFGIDADGGKYRKNKWGGYRVGKHTPSKKFVASVNEKFEGPQNDFEHALWDTLRLSKAATQNANIWIRQLGPDIQSILWEKNSDISGSHIRFRQLNTTHFQMIERRSSLDALACLTILLREAHEIGNAEQSFTIARSLCRVLLMIGDSLNGHGISRPLYEYYEGFILPLANWQEKYISYKGGEFLDILGWLYHGLFHIKDVKPLRLNNKELLDYKLKLLDGGYGFDYMTLLNPIVVSTKLNINSESIEYREIEIAELRRQWALSSIFSGNDGRSTPPI